MLKKMASLAFTLKMIDKQRLDVLEQNAETMLRDPRRALEQLGEKYRDICENPLDFIMKTQAECQQRALEIITEQTLKIFPGIGTYIVPAVEAMLRYDNTKLKNSLSQLIFAAVQNETAAAAATAAASGNRNNSAAATTASFSNFQNPEMQLVLALSFPDKPLARREEFMMEHYDLLASCIVHLVHLTYGIEKQGRLIDSKTITNIFNLYQSIE